MLLCAQVQVSLGAILATAFWDIDFVLLVALVLLTLLGTRMFFYLFGHCAVMSVIAVCVAVLPQCTESLGSVLLENGVSEFINCK